MDQLKLNLIGGETPIHRERDRPKAISIGGWSSFLDDVCLRGGLRFTHEGIIEFLHRVAPEFRTVQSIAELTSAHLIRMEFAASMKPWETSDHDNGERICERDD